MKVKSLERDNSALVIRLERNLNDLRQMKSLLSSYRCEPKTLLLFEHFESLKHGLEHLSNRNIEIIQALKDGKKNVDNYVEKAKTQLQEFSVLQKNIEDYVADARG